MATLDELRESWKTDCHLDSDDMAKSTLNSPQLHSRYLHELITYKLKLAKIHNEVAQYLVKRTKYYRGEMTREELLESGWEQWTYKTLKSEIDQLIEASSEFQQLSMREAYTKTCIYFLESVLQEVKTRSFHVKNMIEWHKFRAGG